MSDNTHIEWADATWNPITGSKGRWSCTKISEGCQFCYAERLNVRFGGPRYVVGADELRLDEQALTQPLRWRRPRRIFVQSMGDLFEERVPDEWIDRIWEVMVAASWHTFLILTKRAERMAKLLAGVYAPSNNVWLGISAENQARLNERVPWLLQTPAAVRFLSLEPLLGPIDLTRVDGRALGFQGITLDVLYGGGRRLEPPSPWGIDWVIVGGESGGPPERALVEDHRRCVDGKGCPGGWLPKWSNIGAARVLCGPLVWVRSIRDQCVAAGISFLMKQWGGPTPKSGGRVIDGKVWHQFPDESGGIYDNP